MKPFFYNAFINLFLLLSIISCSEKETDVTEIIEKEFKSVLVKISSEDKTRFSQAYLVIPRAGCGGCISDAEVFMLNYLKSSSDNRLTFILTDFDSKKILLARFGNGYKSRNIIIDEHNSFSSNEILKSIYPTAYMFNKNLKLVKVSSFSPNENGRYNLQVFLSKSKSE